MLHTKYFTIAHHLLLALVLVAPTWVVAHPAIDLSEKHVTEKLVKKLQSGGYVVFLRHAATDRTQTDQNRNELSNCLSQRNLSAAGRDQARMIGDAMRNLGIPVGTVFSSPYCRCKNTAELAFGKTEIADDLRFGLGDDMQQTARLATSLKTRLSALPAPGTNTILVSHTANLKEAAGIWPQPEGAAYVFKPLHGQDFEYLGRIPPDAWAAELSAAAEIPTSPK